MTDYITAQLKYQRLSNKDIEYLNIQILSKISEWGLTLVNPIRNPITREGRNKVISFDFDISLDDDADTIGSCIEDIKRYITGYLVFKKVFIIDE